MNLKYPELMDQEWLFEQLQTKTRAEIAAERGIPYNSVHNQVKRFPPELKARISRGRFTWETDDKLAIIRDAELRGYTVVAKEYGMDRSQLSHWRIELIDKGLLEPKPIKRGRPRTKAS
jgi:hypothetical protein